MVNQDKVFDHLFFLSLSSLCILHLLVFPLFLPGCYSLGILPPLHAGRRGWVAGGCDVRFFVILRRHLPVEVVTFVCVESFLDGSLVDEAAGGAIVCRQPHHAL